jgi:hypothetical protein
VKEEEEEEEEEEEDDDDETRSKMTRKSRAGRQGDTNSSIDASSALLQTRLVDRTHTLTGRRLRF